MKKVLLSLVLFLAVFSLMACTEDETPTVVVIDDAIIEGVDDVSIPLGDEFSRTAGITATDHNGTDITSSIVVDGLLNVNRAGEYTITYKVTGESGVEVSVSRVITVVENARILGPELLPTNIEVETVYDPMDGVTAADSDDDDLTDSIVLSGSIVGDDNAIDTTTPGTYDLVYSVTGKSGKEVSVTISLTIYEIGDATVTFNGTSEEEPNQYDMVLGIPIDILAIASAEDYDGEDLELDSVTFDASMDALVVDNVFSPTEEGTYTFTYLATGKSEVQTQTVLTVEVVKQGITIDGNYIPVLSNNIDNTGKPWNSTLIYTELAGKGEYGVLVIVDAHGRVILSRDAYGTQYDITNPIKVGAPSVLRSVANADGWSGADSFVGLLGPQGTPGGIPEGGFAIFFSRDNVAGTTHPIRQIGLQHGREFGAKVEITELDIPNYVAPTDDARVIGAEDITLYSNETFDPMAGISGKDHDDSDLTVSIAFNNVDMNKPVQAITDHTNPGFVDGYYSVVYTVTGANGYTVHVTRRVTVLAAILDAEIEGVEDQSIAIGQTFDPMEGGSATDYDGTDLTGDITLEGTVDDTVEGVYTLTYKVTGASNNEVVVTRVITVAADARFEVSETREDTVYVGETFDPWVGIEAFDHDDTDLTSEIVLESLIYEVDTIVTTTAGVYTLTYTVTGDSEVPVVLELTLTILEIPNATLTLATGAAHTMFVNESFNLLNNATATDYDDSVLTGITYTHDESYDALVASDVFTPTTEGTYDFVYKVTGVNGVEVEKTLTVTVVLSGLKVDGNIIPLTQEYVNYSVEGVLTKPANQVTVFTELYGMGEYGVLAIVDAHGRIVLTRDAFGEQVDINNPFKAGNPVFPTNLSGLPNFTTYDQYTGGLWTDWVRGGADVFDGIVGAQGTPGGIPTGGFAIYFANGTTSRPMGLKFARHFAAEVEVVGLTIPNFNPALSDTDASILGAEDITISANDTFDPLAGVTGVDSDDSALTVTVAFNNVDTSKPVITPQPSRVVNTEIGRDNYAQGWYSVVYQVTGSNGYTVNVARRVIVE